MMCPFVVTYSQLLGAILSSGILWPYIDTKKGDWYPADATARRLSGPRAYRVTSLTNSLFVFTCLFLFTQVAHLHLLAYYCLLKKHGQPSNWPHLDLSPFI